MENIIEILKTWNLWEKEIFAGIRRGHYIAKIFPYLERKEVLVLKGIRRSGKSTIVKQLMLELVKQGVEKKQIVYLGLEDYRFAGKLSIDLFEEVLLAYKEYSKNKRRIYFFIDEIQKITSWEKWIRTKYDLDENIKFIVSGSSAALLSKELSTLLTGRNISFTIMPLSFTEYLAFTKEEDEVGLERYMKYGGFPEIVLERSIEKKEVLIQQYFEDILHKDIIDRHAIRNTKQVMDLALYLISASGAKVSVNKLSKVFGLAKDTIQTYINYMCEAYILFEVGYFSYSAKVKHDVSKLPKLYCTDTSFVYHMNRQYFKNNGKLFENVVCIKLAEKGKEIHYWGEGESEVDFIIEKRAINVTATDKIHARERKGLEDFNKKHKGFFLFIITNSLSEENVVPLLEFLKEKE